MPRLKHAGTFDEHYHKQRAPLLPEDASHALFNGAHPELQVDGFVRGDEEVELENLSPRGHLGFRLPLLTPQFCLTRITSPDPNLGSMPPFQAEASPVSPPLDTLVLMPDEDVFYLVYRAVFTIPSLEEIDISLINITYGGKNRKPHTTEA